ncbi:glycosyltransferase family 2 protein [Haliea sp. E17]|uniref:glycosyltransferase family 2 protein n=1 Tax=Haliea sp. E17 TaxID=3401576 RepID=UPI003AB0E18C
MNKSSCLISILVVSWNTRELIGKCISSIYEFLPKQVEFETIIVDNASSDGTCDFVSTNFPEVQLIENQENMGFAQAVNQAAAVSSGRYLLLLNSDAMFIDSSLLTLFNVMESDPSIGVLSGRMISTGNREVMACFGFPSILSLIKDYSIDLIRKSGKGVRGKQRRSVLLKDGQTGCEVDWISGAYLLVRRNVFDGDEPLDRRIFMYFEDTLLCKNAWDRGLRVIILDAAKIYHEGGASAKKVTNVKAMYGYKSSRIYVEEMFGRRALWWYERIIRIVWYLLIPALFIPKVLGFHETALEKQAIFKSLISVPTTT